MRTLFQRDTVITIVGRIYHLTPYKQRLWGKMNVDQMLAHCSVAMQTAIGDKFFKSNLIFKIIGPIFKSQTTNDKQFKMNSPTNPNFVINSTEGFEKEQQNLIKLIYQFRDGGEEKCTKNPHSFFGKLTATQWSSLMYKHLNNHLTQFGV